MADAVAGYVAADVSERTAALARRVEIESEAPVPEAKAAGAEAKSD
jgi:hypothetical protein